jgi:phosphate transport system substrate-binding protein
MYCGQRIIASLLPFCLVLLCWESHAEPLKINGSTTVNLPVAEAAEVLRGKYAMQIHVDTQGGSSGGISMLGENQVQIGTSSKPLSVSDRKKFPAVNFQETRIGLDAVALVVSRDVWESGIKSLSKLQVRDIYEGKIKNWKQLGGKEQQIVFFNKEPGRGTWEVFAKWLYGDTKLAPPVRHPEVGGNEEARTKVSSSRGAISPLSSSWADGKEVFALGIRSEANEIVYPSTQNILANKYPISRSLYLLTNGPPMGNTKLFIDFMLSREGQALVSKHGYLPLASGQ